MGIIVQKFGGTSLANFERLAAAGKKIIQEKKQGHQLVVVVSAMAGETDQLLAKACSMAKQPAARDLDLLLSTGEVVSASLLSIYLQAQGIKAKAFNALQAGILTDRTYGKARILDINVDGLLQELNNDAVIVVTGFQGVNHQHEITTLGRGGSDTTAVALAARLNASECHIYTDVDGVLTTDPKISPSARRLTSITFEEMLELSSLGAKVLQIRAVEMAGRYQVPLRVLNSMTQDRVGTLIALEEEEDNMESDLVSGIACSANEAKLTLLGVSDIPGMAAKVLGPISDLNIDVDMIVQNTSQAGLTDFSFTVQRTDYEQAKKVIVNKSKELAIREFVGNNAVAKISLVGVGMRSHAGVATKMFAVLGNEGISIQLISTSEIKISVIIDEKYMELAVRALHDAFKLEVNKKVEKATI